MPLSEVRSPKVNPKTKTPGKFMKSWESSTEKDEAKPIPKETPGMETGPPLNLSPQHRGKVVWASNSHPS